MRYSIAICKHQMKEKNAIWKISWIWVFSFQVFVGILRFFTILGVMKLTHKAMPLPKKWIIIFQEAIQISCCKQMQRKLLESSNFYHRYSLVEVFPILTFFPPCFSTMSVLSGKWSSWGVLEPPPLGIVQLSPRQASFTLPLHRHQPSGTETKGRERERAVRGGGG